MEGSRINWRLHTTIAGSPQMSHMPSSLDCDILPAMVSLGVGSPSSPIRRASQCPSQPRCCHPFATAFATLACALAIPSDRVKELVLGIPPLFAAQDAFLPKCLFRPHAVVGGHPSFSFALSLLLDTRPFRLAVLAGTFPVFLPRGFVALQVERYRAPARRAVHCLRGLRHPRKEVDRRLAFGVEPPF